MITALIPAHNEFDSIGAAISALRAQTVPVGRIIVIADNCSDYTGRRAELAGAEVVVTAGNTHKKAGALNDVLARVLPGLPDGDYVLVQDADSFLDTAFVEATSRALEAGYAAAGGNFRGRDGGRLCGAFQRNEYARYKVETARKGGKVLCITGVGTMFRVSALKAIVSGIADGTLPDTAGGYCYSYATLTEDNWMTLALRHLGFKVISPTRATMTTEIMPTWRELARQRLRWKRGAIEDLISYGLTRITIGGWLRQLVAILGVLASGAFVGLLVVAPFTGGIHVRLLFVGISVLYAIERAITVRDRGWKVSLLSLTIVGEWGYDLFLQVVHVRALAGTVLRTRASW